MKNLRRISSFVLAAALASAALPLTLSTNAAEPENAQSISQKAGVIGAWRLDMEGRVYVYLRHTDGVVEASTGAAGSTWFVTPPEKTPMHDVEAMVLDIVTRSALAPEPWKLTVTTKIERSLDGKSPETALPILAIASQ